MTAGTAGQGAASGPLPPQELARIDAYWRAANYLSVGQIFLMANPLLAEPLRPEHIKPRLLGHWGTTPGLNLIYAHLNRVITNWDLDAIYVIGPGHGGPGIVANAWLEGTYTEIYPEITRDAEGMRRLLSSHVWRQDHNGFSHQDPGFIDHVVNKKAEIVRVYLPPDANCLLSVADHCLRSRGYVNVIVSGKQPELQWLGMDDAVIHCTRGAGIWEFASNDAGGEPDVVLGCCGDVPTLETLAAAALLREHLPALKVRVVNVVDLMRLEPDTEHPHGMTGPEFDALFTTSRPVIFAFHGYPWLIHRLTYRRTNHDSFHVRGYKEEGTTTTTPFDMAMRNDLDRYHLVMDVIDRVPGLADQAGHIRQLMTGSRLAAVAYAHEHGEDPPEVSGWTWPG